MTVTQRQIPHVLTRRSTTNANAIRDTKKMMPHNVKVKCINNDFGHKIISGTND